MKKYNYFSGVLVGLLYVLSCATTVSANSSWVWISKTNPFDLLPVVMVLTLGVESYALYQYAGIKQVSKVLFWITAANLLSFLVPYIINYSKISMIYPDFMRFLDSGPYYTVGLIYLLMTIVIETPIVYISMIKNVKEKPLLLKLIILSNTLTTVMVFAMERLLCHGHW